MTPERPDDLRIIVDDLGAFKASNIPAPLPEMFSRTIETLLTGYVKALGPEHAVVNPRAHTSLRCSGGCVTMFPGVVGDAGRADEALVRRCAAGRAQ